VLCPVFGGGFTSSVWLGHTGSLAPAVAAARRSGGRAAMTGQGLWPTQEEARPLLRALAAQFAVVDVRDEASAGLLKDTCEVSLTGDDMFFGRSEERRVGKGDSTIWSRSE